MLGTQEFFKEVYSLVQGQQTFSAKDQTVKMGDLVSQEENGGDSVDTYITTEDVTHQLLCCRKAGVRPDWLWDKVCQSRSSEMDKRSLRTHINT